ncbi:troponin I, fast skeletal muscle [Kogia breviceps]|uniref:troponin I, fast skeletal muscle n=1 Tax=Kogia breviceps TaxID=27615 RepID=UPI0034D2E25D
MPHPHTPPRPPTTTETLTNGGSGCRVPQCSPSSEQRKCGCGLLSGEPLLLSEGCIPSPAPWARQHPPASEAQPLLPTPDPSPPNLKGHRGKERVTAQRRVLGPASPPGPGPAAPRAGPPGCAGGPTDPEPLLPALQKRRRAITARRQHLKSIMLQIAATELQEEESRREKERQSYLSEHCPPLHTPSSMAEVQELCQQLHAKINVAEEEKYDMEVKVQKSSKELEDMNQKLFDLRGKFKRPPLRRVRMSADAMLKALLGSKHKVCMDLRANLKQVKKEETEKERDLRDVGDWRKNIEEKSGMEGRKKMFESES